MDDSGTATVVPSSIFKVKVIQLEDGTLAFLHTEPQGRDKYNYCFN